MYEKAKMKLMICTRKHFSRSLLKLETIHRRVQTTTDESQTTTDESQMTKDKSHTTTDESQTNHKQLQTSHRWVTDDYIRITPKVFLNIFIKYYFQKGYDFSNAPMKRWFLLKVMETLHDNKSGSFNFLTSFSLDVRAWSTETQTNISFFLYSGA